MSTKDGVISMEVTKYIVTTDYLFSDNNCYDSNLKHGLKSMCRSNGCTVRKQFGSSMIEFLIVVPLLLLLGLGTVQVALLYHAKTILNYATFEAARAGAVNHALIQPMKKELSHRMAPVFGGRGESHAPLMTMAKNGALEILAPALELYVINPTKQIFDEWGVLNTKEQRLEIPNYHTKQIVSDELRANVTLHDANILKIQSVFHYKLTVPIASKVILQTLSVINPAKARSYKRGSMPLNAVATVRMQNEAWFDDGDYTEQIALINDGNRIQLDDETSSVLGVPEAATSSKEDSESNNDGISLDQHLPECDKHGLGPLKASMLVQNNNPELAQSGNEKSIDASQGAVASKGMCEATAQQTVEDYLSDIQSQFEPCQSRVL